MILLISALFILIVLFGFVGYSSIVMFVNDFLDKYLSLVERIADWLLKLVGSEVIIRDHNVFIGGEVVHEFQWIAYKKWLLGLFILFWITRTSITRKLIFTAFLLIANFSGSVIDVWFTSYLLDYAPDEYSATLMGYNPHLLLLLTIITVWIWRERKSLFTVLTRIRIRMDSFENKLPAIILVVFLYALMSKFFLGCFQYTPWISFLFHTSAWILNLIGYPAWVESHLLIGDNGSIYMAKPCLGLNTMLLFAAIVFITGKNNRARWIYILSGIVFLNIVNIIRFVLLFIHIQKHGDYVLSMDLHDMYNYIIYGIVFILWIIWFEKYSDIRESPAGGG